jgi:hypothetical protein
LLEGGSLSTANTSDELYRRLLLPFVDVVCLFVEDIGGIYRAVAQLKSWTVKGPLSMSAVRPHLMLITRRGKMRDVRSFLNSAFENDIGTLSDFFQHIHVVTFAYGARRWEKKQLLTLRRKIFRTIRLVQNERRKFSFLFSASHTVEFLNIASRSAFSPGPFDFIGSSRLINPVPTDLVSHLTKFFSCFERLDRQDHHAISLVTSSIILDQYPPGMHRKQLVSPILVINLKDHRLFSRRRLPDFVSREIFRVDFALPIGLFRSHGSTTKRPCSTIQTVPEARISSRFTQIAVARVSQALVSAFHRRDMSCVHTAHSSVLLALQALDLPELY